jgi:hypothetical protein
MTQTSTQGLPGRFLSMQGIDTGNFLITQVKYGIVVILCSIEKLIFLPVLLCQDSSDRCPDGSDLCSLFNVGSQTKRTYIFLILEM